MRGSRHSGAGHDRATVETGQRRRVILVELPSFPKGIPPLSLQVVGALLEPQLDFTIVDLNLASMSEFRARVRHRSVVGCGLKVSSQNWHIARELTAAIRAMRPDIRIFWGGEFPTLCPEQSAVVADSVVSGPFEPVAHDFVRDLLAGTLQVSYQGNPAEAYPHSPARPSRNDQRGYSSFMGHGLETSRGCVHGCSFCLVHVMQKKIRFKSLTSMQSELAALRGKFVNVVDYNIGMNRDHCLRVASAFARSETLGWMAEACIDDLDDDELLAALSAGRCRVLYCGLESIQDEALRGVRKSFNPVDRYEKIIRKVQQYGIQIACGVILGLPGDDSTLSGMLQFCSKLNIVYVKLTFLTYNPMTHAHKVARTAGRFLTDDPCRFDGNHLSYLAHNQQDTPIYEGATKFIKHFYSVREIWNRSAHLSENLARRVEFAGFAYLYGRPYHQWQRFNVLTPSGGKFDELLRKPFRKGLSGHLCELAIAWARRRTRLQGDEVYVSGHKDRLDSIRPSSVVVGVPEHKQPARPPGD